jgi:flagellar basal body-associated protein FliL
MDEQNLKPTERPEFKQTLKIAIIVLAVAAVVVVATILFGG